MYRNMKIRNGGIYLVYPGRTVDPELRNPHYCVIMKTYDKNLFLALPTTSKHKIDQYVHIIPEDNSRCLFKHMRIVSKGRIIKPLLDRNGNPVILSNDSLIDLVKDYQCFIKDTCDKAILSNKMSCKALQNV